MALQFMTTLEEGNGIKTVTPENVEALTVFCLQTQLSDFKVMGVFIRARNHHLEQYLCWTVYLIKL